jgi:hypothetical protein
MKGVIAGTNSEATIIDITHAIPPQDVLGAALALASAYSYFPEGTVFCSVVDPGVGGKRRIIALQTKKHRFIAPDNGLLTLVCEREQILNAVSVEESKYFLKKVSPTFHGRDIFVPVAAHLAQGLALNKLGPKTGQITKLPWPSPEAQADILTGEILYIDHFGNAISNVDAELVKSTFGNDFSNIAVNIEGRLIQGIRTYYAQAHPGDPVALIGSAGLLEIALREGSAAKALGLKRGSSLILKKMRGGGSFTSE